MITCKIKNWKCTFTQIKVIINVSYFFLINVLPLLFDFFRSENIFFFLSLFIYLFIKYHKQVYFIWNKCFIYTIIIAYNLRFSFQMNLRNKLYVKYLIDSRKKLASDLWKEKRSQQQNKPRINICVSREKLMEGKCILYFIKFTYLIFICFLLTEQ